jgi:hypothetical protein
MIIDHQTDKKQINSLRTHQNSPDFSKIPIFSCVRPIYERAVSNLDP